MDHFLISKIQIKQILGIFFLFIIYNKLNRFIYAAVSISNAFNDFSYINKEKVIEYI
jgi:hypothetical protein